MSKRPAEEEISDPRATTKSRDAEYPDTFRDNLVNGGSLGSCLRQEVQSQKEELAAINERCKVKTSEVSAPDGPVSDELKEKMEEVRQV